jgi:hypothetical protein
MRTPTLAGVELRTETLDFILDYTKDTPRRQDEVSHMIDTKALQLFGAASIVLGLAAAGPLREGAAAWLFGAALVVYVAAAVAAFSVLRTRDFRVVDDADNIWSAVLGHGTRRGQTRSHRRHHLGVCRERGPARLERPCAQVARCRNGRRGRSCGKRRDRVSVLGLPLAQQPLFIFAHPPCFASRSSASSEPRASVAAASVAASVRSSCQTRLGT